jgi:asparagine synthetase B (glutamine-hydrolysing)
MCGIYAAFAAAKRPFYAETKLVEFSYTIPFEYKVQSGNTKYVLKKVAETIFPERIVNRKKQPFFMPLSDIGKDLQGDVRRTLSREKLEGRGISITQGVSPC